MKAMKTLMLLLQSPSRRRAKQESDKQRRQKEINKINREKVKERREKHLSWTETPSSWLQVRRWVSNQETPSQRSTPEVMQSLHEIWCPEAETVCSDLLAWRQKTSCSLPGYAAHWMGLPNILGFHPGGRGFAGRSSAHVGELRLNVFTVFVFGTWLRHFDLLCFDLSKQ